MVFSVQKISRFRFFAAKNRRVAFIVFVILAATAAVICLFQGCLTLWIIRTAARRRPQAKGEAAGWRTNVSGVGGDEGGDAGESIPISLILSLLHTHYYHPYRRRCRRRRSAHVISVADACGCPPPPNTRDFDVRIRRCSAHVVDARVRDVAATALPARLRCASTAFVQRAWACVCNLLAG